MMHHEHEGETLSLKSCLSSRELWAGRCPLATARFRITSGRKPGGPLSSDRRGIVGVRHGRAAELFWLDQKRRSAHQRVCDVQHLAESSEKGSSN